MRDGGQYVAMTLPIRLPRGTVPHRRESQEPLRLSPIMKYCPFGIFIGPCVKLSRRSGFTYGSFSFVPLMKTKPLTSFQVSPGRPIRRLTNTPPDPQISAARGGVLKT